MKVLKYLVFTAAVCLVCLAYAVQAKSSEEEEILYTAKVDVTGDSRKDMIVLKGIPYQTEEGFFKKISLMVNNRGVWSESELEPGYSPKIRFADLNHDGVRDILADTREAKSGPIESLSAFSFKTKVPRQLELPGSAVAEAVLTAGYKASVTTAAKEKTLLDLTSLKGALKRLGFYQDGLLNEQSELTVHSFSALEVRNGTDGPVLVGEQSISGPDESMAICRIKSTWKLQGKAWTLSGTEIVPEDQVRILGV